MPLPAFTASYPDQDYIVLAGVKSPGVARVSPPDSPRNWDVRQGYGFDGAYSAYTGAGLSKFSVRIELTEGDQFATPWLNFAKLLAKPAKGQRPKAMSIRHPVLEIPPWSITSVVVTDAKGFEVDDTGLYWCSVDFLQFKAPKPVLVKPVAAIPGVNTGVPTALDAADLAVVNAMADYQRNDF